MGSQLETTINGVSSSYNESPYCTFLTLDFVDWELKGAGESALQSRAMWQFDNAKVLKGPRPS